MTISVEQSEQFVESLFVEDHILRKVEDGIRGAGMPEISIAAGYGRLLTMLVRMSNAKRALEIGALGGYSGICIARGLPADGKLISLEVNPDFAVVAQRHVQMAELSERVDYRIGDAKDSLAKLEEEQERFDFFFIDADKGGYPTYLEAAIKLANPGAIIIGDNVLMHGRAADPDVASPSVIAMREFSRAVATDPRLESTILPAYDGLAIARVKV